MNKFLISFLNLILSIFVLSWTVIYVLVPDVWWNVPLFLALTLYFLISYTVNANHLKSIIDE